MKSRSSYVYLEQFFINMSQDVIFIILSTLITFLLYIKANYAFNCPFKVFFIVIRCLACLNVHKPLKLNIKPCLLIDDINIY